MTSERISILDAALEAEASLASGKVKEKTGDLMQVMSDASIFLKAFSEVPGNLTKATYIAQHVILDRSIDILLAREEGKAVELDRWRVDHMRGVLREFKELRKGDKKYSRKIKNAGKELKKLERNIRK